MNGPLPLSSCEPMHGSPPGAIASAEISAAPARMSSRLERSDWLILAALLAVFALARVTLFPFAENLYGDSVVRSELAERWANEPTLYTSFKDGVYQFGPLHFYYMGVLLRAWPSREHATRLASLLMGLLVVLPVYRLGKRLFSRRAAVVAALSMAAWGLHIQASTTAASEAVFLTLFLFALDFLFQGLEEHRFGPLALAALCTNLFCALRYDGWLYAPLLALIIALSGKDRIASVTRSLMFAGLCAPFPLWWMQMNEKATGDALYPVHYIEQFHARWVLDDVGRLGHLGQRIYAILFWPGSVLVTVSVLVGAFALAGIAHALLTKERRALALLALVPAGYYAFRGGVLVNFSPLARFFMAQTTLALFYVDEGFAWLCGRLPAVGRRAVAIFAGVLAVGTTAYLGQATAWKSGVRAEALRPISPLSTLPTDQMALARYLQKNVARDELVIIDEAPQYMDINVAFFSGLPEERLARRRWENFEKQLREHPNAPWMFLAKKGVLEEKDGLIPGETSLTWRGRAWQRVFAPSESLFVYRQAP